MIGKFEAPVFQWEVERGKEKMRNANVKQDAAC